MAGMFDIFKWGMKPPTTLGGYAGDIEGEAQMPSMIGQRITKSQGGPIPIPQQNQGALQPNAQGANITMADGASLAKWAGLDLKQLERNWKDKGGFEGLMANPAFSLGLAMIQSSAQGKRIDEALMNNFIKAAGISAQFKDRIAARAGGVIEATEGQMNEIKQVLATKGMDKPGWWRKILPGNQSEMWEQAVEDVAVKVQKKVNAMKRQAKASGKDIVVGKRLYKKIIDDMIKSGEIKKVGGVKAAGYQLIDATLESRAKGGPVRAGKPYMVGEKGPEVVIPRQSGKVVSNDDARIFAMLLAANPQLQKVSKARAEKIIRARFPEYFEV
tara:strand:+ start:1185 stop:2171 length:987 start_codon:yes stop_codon:yes gene_type:complete